MINRINIGCGRTPTKGWANYDNSPAIKLANSKLRYSILKLFKLLNKDQIANIEWNKINKIEFVDATKKLPFSNSSLDCIYSSHMLEHLSYDDAKFFISESFRVLRHNGILRLAVPDLGIAIDDYIKNKDADAFIKGLHVAPPPISNLKQKIILLLNGYRHHQWMYDNNSLSLLVKNCGFRKIEICEPGQSFIKDNENLDLFERKEHSLYVECIKI